MRRQQISVAEALTELKSVLGKWLYPAAIPRIKEILARLREGDVDDSQMSALSKRK